MPDLLDKIVSVSAIVISLFTLIMMMSRTSHQNAADNGTYVKNVTDMAEINTKARLETEQRAEKLETRITDLEKLLDGMAYRVTFVVHTGEEPRIEKISVERFSNSRLGDEKPMYDARKKVMGVNR